MTKITNKTRNIVNCLQDYDRLDSTTTFLLKSEKLLEELCKSNDDWDDRVSGRPVDDYRKNGRVSYSCFKFGDGEMLQAIIIWNIIDCGLLQLLDIKIDMVIYCTWDLRMHIGYPLRSFNGQINSFSNKIYFNSKIRTNRSCTICQGLWYGMLTSFFVSKSNLQFEICQICQYI